MDQPIGSEGFDSYDGAHGLGHGSGSRNCENGQGDDLSMTMYYTFWKNLFHFHV